MEEQQQPQKQQQDFLHVQDPTASGNENLNREHRRPSLTDLTSSFLGRFARDRARTPPPPGSAMPKTPEKHLPRPDTLQVPDNASPTPRSRRRTRSGTPEPEPMEEKESKSKSHRMSFRPELLRSRSDSPAKESHGTPTKEMKDGEGMDKSHSKMSGLKSLSKKFMRSLPEIRITDVDPANIPLPPTPNPKIPSKSQAEGTENTPLRSALRHSASFDSPSDREVSVEPNPRRAASFEMLSRSQPLEMDKLLPLPPGLQSSLSSISDEDDIEPEDFPAPPPRRPSVTFNLEPQTIPLPPSPQPSMISIEQPLQRPVVNPPRQKSKSQSLSPPPPKGLHTIPEIPPNIKAALVLLEHLSEEDITKRFFPALLEVRFPRLDEEIHRFLRFSGLKGIYDKDEDRENHTPNVSHLSIMSMRFVGRTLLSDHELGDAVARVLVHETRQVQRTTPGSRSSSSSSDSSSSSSSSNGSGASGYESDMESLADGSSDDGDGPRHSIHDSERDEHLPVRYLSNIPSLDAKRSYFQLTKLAIAELKVKYERESMTMSEYLLAYSSLSEMMGNLPIFGSYSAIQIIDIYISIGEVMPASRNLSVYNMGKLRNILQYLDDSCIVVLAELRPDESERDYIATEQMYGRLMRERKAYLRDGCYWKAEGYFVETIMLVEKLATDPAGRILWGREGKGGSGNGGDHSDDYDSDDSEDIVYMGNGSDEDEDEQEEMEMEKEANDAGWESYEEESTGSGSSDDSSQPFIDAEEEKDTEKEEKDEIAMTKEEDTVKDDDDGNTLKAKNVEEQQHSYLGDKMLIDTDATGGVSLARPGPGDTSGVKLMKAAITGVGAELL